MSLRRSITERLSHAPAQFCQLESHCYSRGTLGVLANDKREDEQHRVLDRELQRMRRAGLITYDRAARQWRLADQPARE